MPRPTDPPDQPHREPAIGLQAVTSFRLAVGLAHAIPGAELTIRRSDGGHLVAANRPGADLHLCGLRRLVMSEAGPTIADRWAEVVKVGGTVVATNDGLWSSAWPESKRWFATALRQDRVASVLADLDTSDIGDEDIEVVLKPDPCLGLTAVGISAVGAVVIGTGLAERRNELARRAHAACLVNELIASVQAVSARADTASGHRSGAETDDATKGKR